MIIYLICFLISIIFMYLTEKSTNKWKKRISLLISFLAPTILAAFRGYNVGTDISIYGKLYFDLAAVTKSMSNYLVLYKSVEYGYLIINFIVSRIINNFNFFLFVVQFIINFGVFYYIYNKEDDVPKYLKLMTYLFFFYNITFNIIRQSVAISIFLYAMFMAEKKAYLKSVIILFFAVFFHISIIATFPIVFLMMVFNSSRYKSKEKFFFATIVALSLGMLMMNYERIMYFLVYILNLLPEKYYNYILPNAIGEIQLRSFILLLILRVIIYSFAIIGTMCANKIKSYKEEHSDKNYIYILLLIIDLLVFLLKYKMTNIDRLGFYYSLLGILNTYPKFYLVVKKNKFNKILLNIILFGILFVYWYVVFIHYNMNETYPYYIQIY